MAVEADEPVAKRRRAWGEGLEGSYGSLQSGYKTQMCKFFAMGQCVKGPECSYAHSEEEMSPSSNGKNGRVSMSQLQSELEAATMSRSMEDQNDMSNWAHGDKKFRGLWGTEDSNFGSSGSGEGMWSGEAGGGSTAAPYGAQVQDWASLGPGGGNSGGSCGGVPPGGRGGGGWVDWNGWSGCSVGCRGDGGAVVNQIPRGSKTLMCKFFPLGQCVKAELCTYAHSEEEILQQAAGALEEVGVGDGMSEGCAGGKQGNAALSSWSTDDGALISNAVYMLPPPRAAQPAYAIPAPTEPGCPICPIAKAAKGSCGGKGDPFGKGCGCSDYDNEWGKGYGGGFGMEGKGGKGKSWNGAKTQICKFYPNCQKGDRCTFAHCEEGDLQEYSQMSEAGSRDVSMFVKTRMCKFFEQNRCTKGEACPYAHGPQELRQKGQQQE